jgi:glycosyltransferase involved in cell wall biosynthesis
MSQTPSLSASVVMAAYNGARFLDIQLRSVLVDLRPDDELVIVDDASTDATPEMIAGFGDRRIRYYRNDTNLGVLKSFEKAIGLARYPIIFLCDQDDIWVAGKRHAVISVFERQHCCKLVIHDAQVIDALGAVTSPSFMATRGGFRAGIIRNLFRNRYLGCAIAFRSQLRATVLPIPPTVPMHDMWIGMLANLRGSVVYLPTTYLQYRRHDGNVSPPGRQPLLHMLKFRWQLVALLVRRLVARSRSSSHFDMD